MDIIPTRKFAAASLHRIALQYYASMFQSCVDWYIMKRSPKREALKRRGGDLSINFMADCCMWIWIWSQSANSRQRPSIGLQYYASISGSHVNWYMYWAWKLWRINTTKKGVMIDFRWKLWSLGLLLLVRLESAGSEFWLSLCHGHKEEKGSFIPSLWHLSIMQGWLAFIRK